MGSTNRKPSTDEDKLRSIYAEYKKHILPLEQKSMFNSLGDQAYTEEEILAKNMILILGQYSTGKTTFIRALLSGREYPGMNIAADPATDKFIPIIRGDTKKNIPGNALIYDQVCKALPTNQVKCKAKKWKCVEKIGEICSFSEIGAPLVFSDLAYAENRNQ